MIYCPFCNKELKVNHISSYIKECNGPHSNGVICFWIDEDAGLMARDNFSVEFDAKTINKNYIDHFRECVFSIDGNITTHPKIERTKENIINLVEYYIRLRRLQAFT
jgi:hypothetical protein